MRVVSPLLATTRTTLFLVVVVVVVLVSFESILFSTAFALHHHHQQQQPQRSWVAAARQPPLRFMIRSAFLSFVVLPNKRSFFSPVVSSRSRGVTNNLYLSMSTATTTTCSVSTNPLMSDWSLEPFHLPPFSKIQPYHFPEALREGRKQQLEDLQAIVDCSDEPTFENVLVPYDRAGWLLTKVENVFSNYCSSLNTEELQTIQMEQSSISARHESATYTLKGLFPKIESVYYKMTQKTTTTSNYTPEQIRLTERIYKDFVRAGAKLDTTQQAKYADIQAELATLCTQFTQNVLKDEESYELILSREELHGCPDSLLEAAKQVAIERNKQPHEYVITLSRSLVEPFLTYATNRTLREKAFRAWTQRGELYKNEEKGRDNVVIAQEILKLRLEQAKLHNYTTFADYQCEDKMAKTPQNVRNLLENVWERSKVAANREREELEAYIRTHENEEKEFFGDATDGTIQPWDWRYYAEKVRQEKYDFDESLLKPYLSLDKMTDALMAVSKQLFGLEYIYRPDIVAYHPDVKVYEVHEKVIDEQQQDGSTTNKKLVAIFLVDNFARPHKSSGAWMSEFRSQTKNFQSAGKNNNIEGIPIVVNNNNFAKAGKNTLLSFDDVETMFHEAGHGHHGMLSDATYSRLASTNVLTDFVELPSQLMEHWFREPEVLKKYAKHYETNEVIPDELLNKLLAARAFNQGFATIEYTACALLDMYMHQMEDYTNFDLIEFEKEQLERLGMPDGIVMRHRPAHFQHLFSGSHYAAGYYVYLWAEVLDADAFAAFQETGDIFHQEVANKARKYIYSAGNTVAPDELFRMFRGRDPDINFMLQKKGLVTKTN